MASRSTYVVPGDIPERTSWQYNAVMVDASGAPIPRDALDTLRLTIYVKGTGNPIINNVQNVDILNFDRGVVGQFDGSLQVNFHAADGPILDDTATTETHVAVIAGTYNAGVDGFNRAVEFRVTNLGRVPA